MPNPHCVIDVRMLRHAGIGRYISNVIPRVIAARPNWHFTLLAPPAPGEAADWTRFGDVDLVPTRAAIYSVAEQLEIPAKVPRSATMFWAPHYNVPLLERARLVVTVHDIAHLAVPEMKVGRMARAYARGMLSSVRRRAKFILFDSDFTNREFERVVGHPIQSEAIHLGVDPAWTSLASSTPLHPRPYVLFVGSIKPHKNLTRLVQAFRRLDAGVDLVLIGAWRGQRSIDRAALADIAQLGDRARFVESPDDATVATYMAQARALVMPSLYEGFGLPALEAMALGCPVIVSNAASLPEICGDAAAYCDPMDPDDIGRQIRTVLGDSTLRSRLSAAGRRRALEFDWNVTAARTAAAIESVAV